jgi:hypothetical protein
VNPLCDRYRSLVDSIKAYQSEPLDEETKQRIYGYLVNPTPTAWSDIAGIMVNNRLATVWQAVRRVDPSFPATGRRYELGSGRLLKEWERIPHLDLVLDAIKHAQEENVPSVA